MNVGASVAVCSNRPDPPRSELPRMCVIPRREAATLRRPRRRPPFEPCGFLPIGTAARVMVVRRYVGTMYDSNRWDGFELRPGDIIIATPPKCGTTWTQMICALLILQEPELPLPLNRLSPWIDMVTRARTEVFADLQAQTHRRFIKTHTPLDGIPNDPRSPTSALGATPATLRCRSTTTSTTRTSTRSSKPASRPQRSTASSSDRCNDSRRVPTASGTASGNGSTTRRPPHRSGRRCGAPSSTSRRSATPPPISTSCTCTTTT